MQDAYKKFLANQPRAFPPAYCHWGSGGGVQSLCQSPVERPKEGEAPSSTTPTPTLVLCSSRTSLGLRGSGLAASKRHGLEDNGKRGRREPPRTTCHCPGGAAGHSHPLLSPPTGDPSTKGVAASHPPSPSAGPARLGKAPEPELLLVHPLSCTRPPWISPPGPPLSPPQLSVLCSRAGNDLQRRLGQDRVSTRRPRKSLRRATFPI